MRTAKNFGLVVCVLAAAAGCAAPVDEANESSDSALKSGGSYRSPIANGLYTDGDDNYLRAFPETGSFADQALATQYVQWSFDGAKGGGVADVTSGRVEVTSTCKFCDRSSLTIVRTAKGLDVKVVGGEKGTPARLALHKVDFSFLNGWRRPSAESASNFVIQIANATSEGLDITVAGNATHSTQHLSWKKDYFFSAQSTDCGGLAFQRNELAVFMMNTPLSAACTAFGALHDANGGASVILE